MRTIFLDTVGLIAIWEQADQWHRAAAKVFAELLADGVPPVTTPHVLLECGNALARRPSRMQVPKLRKDLSDVGSLIVPTPAEEESAWEAYARGDAGQAGIVDHISFAVMRRLGITEAFTNDQHFAAAGFKVLF